MYLDSGDVATERDVVGICGFDCDFGTGTAVAFLLVGLGVKESLENSLGVFGWEDEPKRERAHLEVSPSTGVVWDAVVEREVLEEDCDRFEVSSAPEDVTS